MKIHRIIFTAMFILLRPDQTHAAESNNPRKERFAALECQDNGVFAIINFFPDRTYSLTWGRDDQVIAADVPVTRHDWGVSEIFAGKGVHLTLPVSRAESSISPRLGELRVKKPVHGEWTGLRCLLHGAD